MIGTLVGSPIVLAAPGELGGLAIAEGIDDRRRGIIFDGVVLMCPDYPEVASERAALARAHSVRASQWRGFCERLT